MAVERIRDSEIAIVTDHLRACSVSEPLGEAPMLGEVMAGVRVTTLKAVGTERYETRFRFKPKTSTRPLSMGELVALIDGATGHLGGRAKGLTGAYRAYNAAFGGDPERLVDFVIVTSDFYPELFTYYAEEAREWLVRVTAK